MSLEYHCICLVLRFLICKINRWTNKDLLSPFQQEHALVRDYHHCPKADLPASNLFQFILQSWSHHPLIEKLKGLNSLGYHPKSFVHSIPEFSEAPWEATWGHWHKSREPRVSWSNPRKTWRVLFQRLLMPDSPTMTPEQGRAPLATSRKTDFPSTTQEAPWVPHHTSWENPQWRRSSRKTTRCPRQGEMGAFFSCLTWRAIPGPLSKLHRRIDSL